MKRRKVFFAVLLVITTLSLTIPTQAFDFSEDSWALLQEQIVPNGVYYLKNVGTELYLQIDDNDDDNGFLSDGAHMEVHEGNYTAEQRWRISKLNGVYYRITSEASGLALSVPEGKENNENCALVQEAYTGEARQQWRFMVDDFGNYTIRPRSREAHVWDYCVAVGSGIFLTGTNVEQRDYDSGAINGRYEWNLYPIYDTVLLGHNVPHESWDRSLFLEPTADYMSMRTDSIYTDYYEEYTVDQMLQCLHRCSMLYVHTHGLYNSVQLAYRPVVNLEMSDVAPYDLSHMEFVLLLTCDTAAGGYDQSRVDDNNPYNIVEQLVACGVETVIGFRDATSPNDCNWFAEQFTLTALTLYNLCDDHRDNDGYCENCISVLLTIEEAVRATHTSDLHNYFFSILELGGNGRNCLYE